MHTFTQSFLSFLETRPYHLNPFHCNTVIISPVSSLFQLISCPARVVQWLDHLGAMCSRAWRTQCAAGPEFNPSHGPVRHVRPRKSNYVKIIPMHTMIRQQRVRRCPL